MNETLLKANERGRLRGLVYKFDTHAELFFDEFEVSPEERAYIFKELFLKEIIQDIDAKLLSSYKRA